VIARLHDFDIAEDLSEPEREFHQFVFHRPEGLDHGEERVTVVWSEGEILVIEIPDDARVIDLVGSPVEPLMFGVGVTPRTQSIGASPIYIVEEIAP
jgi:hypothetical protein